MAGFGFIGSFRSLTSLSSAVTPLAIVSFKSLCLPILTLGAITWFQRKPTRTQTDFTFGYALLPCANSALVIARIYGADADLLATLAASLSLNKVAGFLLLFVAGVLTTAGDDTAELLMIKSVFSNLMVALSLVGRCAADVDSCALLVYR